jgi:hypothetical protein
MFLSDSDLAYQQMLAQGLAGQQAGGLLGAFSGWGQAGLHVRYSETLSFKEKMRIEVKEYLKDWDK